MHDPPADTADRRLPWLGALCVAVTLAPAWLLGRVPVRADAMAYFWPLRERLASYLGEGKLPLYDLANHGGTPLLVQPQTAAFYPLHWLYALLPTSLVFAWMHALHVALLGWGTLLLLRRIGFGGAPATLGALTLALGGTVLSLSAMQDKLLSLAWAPFALVALLAAISAHSRTHQFRALLGAAAAVTLAVLAGGLDVVILTGAAAGVLISTDAGRAPLNGWSAVRLFQVGLAFAVAAALTAIQWLPFWSWLQGTEWTSLASADVLSRSLRPGHLLGLILPNAGYDPTLDDIVLPWRSAPLPFYLPGAYAGGIGLLLGLLGGLHGAFRAGPARVALVGVGVFGILALGSAIPPVGWLESHVPVLSMVRYPHKWVLPAALLASVLVAQGGRVTLEALPRARWPWLLVAALALASAGMATMTSLRGGPWSGMLASGAAAMAAAAAGLLLLSLSRFTSRGAGLLALAVLLTGADLAWHNLQLAPTRPAAEAWRTPTLVTALRSEPVQPRLFPYSYSAFGIFPETQPGASPTDMMRESLLPGIPAAHGIVLPLGWLVGQPSGLGDAYRSLGTRSPTDRIEALRTFGVTHMSVNREEHASQLLQLPGVSEVSGGMASGPWGRSQVVRIDDPLPEARWLPADETNRTWFRIDPRVDHNGRFEVDVAFERAGRIVWLRPWDAGWLAAIDGTPTLTRMVNGFQLALDVPAGAHTVRLQYLPRRLGLGLGISAVTSALLLLAALVAFRPSRFRLRRP